MSLARSFLRVFFCRLLPLLFLLLAVSIGWLLQQEVPEGALFAAIIPLSQGYKPPVIFGHGHMTGTPEILAGAVPLPPSKNATSLPLQGSSHSIPQIGIGMCCRPSAYDDVLVERTVLHFLLLGGRHIDTAHLYLNHRAVGRGIRKAIERGIPRSEIFVTTKIWGQEFGSAAKQAVRSFLEELGLDYIDLVLMHSPVVFLPGFLKSNECYKHGLDETACRIASWQSLSEARAEGLVRSIGVSNFMIPQLEELEESRSKDSKLAPIAANQIQFNPWAPDDFVDTFNYCQQNEIAVIAYYSLGGAMQQDLAFSDEVLLRIANAHNKSVSNVLLRWAIQNKAVVIPGTGNPKHMVDNLSNYDFALSDSEMEEIDALRKNESAKKFSFFRMVKNKNP
jgi:diketogulonate reductase-like aldo/keto reductase